MTAILPSASQITKKSVMRYLETQGWDKKISRDGRLVKYTLADQPSLSAPVNIFFSDHTGAKFEKEEIDSAVSTIMSLYDVQPYAIFSVIGNLAFDQIFSKIPTEYVRNNSIDLKTATIYINSLRSFLAASATTEISQGKFFKRTLKEAITYAGNCRFGHTYQGSFGFVIESPISASDASPVANGEAPLGRRVVRRIARGLSSFNAAIAQDEITPIISAENGMSANMCDEIVALIEEAEVSKLDISINFSPEFRELDSNLSNGPFIVEKKYVELLKDASNRLRKEEIPKRETVVGRVVKLETEANPADSSDRNSLREITVSWDSSEYGPIRVQLAVNAVSYLKAVDAHRTGQLFLVTGMLKRQGRYWVLGDSEEPTLITVSTPLASEPIS